MHKVGPAVIGFPDENAQIWPIGHICSDVPGKLRSLEGRRCTHYPRCIRKETTIMAALTLEEWRDRTLEQVHFAAQAALNAVAVQVHPRHAPYISASATCVP